MPNAISPTPQPSRRIPAALWFVIVPLALVALAWAALALFLPPARVRAIVQAQLAGALNREVRYRDARIELWPPVRLTVVEPALAEPGGFTRGTAFSARSLHLDLDVFALIAHRLVVRRLVIDQPQIHLTLHEDGTTNFDQLSPPAPAASQHAARPLDLAMQELSVTGGGLIVDDLKSRRRLALAFVTRIGLSAQSAGTRIGISGTTLVSKLAFGALSAQRPAELNTSLASLTWKIDAHAVVDLRQERLALEALSLRFGRTALTVSGVIDRPGPSAALDLRARGHDVDLAEIMSFLAAADARAVNGVHAAGQLDFDLALRGRLGQRTLPALTGVLRLKGASFRYPDAPASVEQLNLTANFAPDSLGIPDLRAVVSGRGATQPVTAQLGVTRFADPNVWFALQGNLDLAAIGPLVAPRGVALGGHVAVDLKGRGRVKDPASMSLDGHATLADVTLEGGGLPRKVEAVNGAIAFSSARADVKALTARAGQSSFTLDAAITRPLALTATPGSTPPSLVDFALRSPYLDLAELLPATPGGPMAPNASGGGQVRIERLRNQKLDVTHLDARVVLEPGVVSIPSFTMNAYDGRVAGNARFDLNDAARPIFAVKARVDSAEADALLSAWTPLKGLLRGKLNTAIDLSGEGQTPELLARSLTAQGLAAFANGTLGPTPALEAIANAIGIPSARVTRVQELRLPFSVKRGRVVSDGATMRTSLGEWKFTGSAGFDGSLDYALSGTVPRDRLSGSDLKSALAIGGMTDSKGDLLLDLKLGGTSRAPRVSLDARAMQDRVAGKLSQSLSEQQTRMQEQIKESLLTPLTATHDSSGKPDIARNAQALIDSLKKKRGADILRDLFRPAKRDTSHPASRDTTHP